MKKEIITKILARVIFYGFAFVAAFSGFMLLFTFVDMVESWKVTNGHLAMCIIYLSFTVLFGAFIKMLRKEY